MSVPRSSLNGGYRKKLDVRLAPRTRDHAIDQRAHGCARVCLLARAGCLTRRRSALLRDDAEDAALAEAAADAVDEGESAAAETEGAPPAEVAFDVPGHGRVVAATSDAAGFVGRFVRHATRHAEGSDGESEGSAEDVDVMTCGACE